jgi:hypothetical protein
MAKRKRQRPANGLKTSDRPVISLSTGYRAIIDRPSMRFVVSIQEKAEKDFPFPNGATETLELVTGDTVTIKPDVPTDFDRMTPEQKEVVGKRNEYLLEYVFNHRLEIEGYESEEDRQALVAQFADERAELEEFGVIAEDMKDLDPWQFTLRMFIIAEAADYAAVQFAVLQAFDRNNVTEDEIRQRVNFL